MFIAGDIGGTKTNLALFEAPQGKIKIVKEQKFSSKGSSSLEEIIEQFIQDKSMVLESAAFGIAGAIENNVCQTTNLPWHVDGNHIGNLLRCPKVKLINDLEANAHGIACLEEKDFFCLNAGIKQSGNAALISAGTGLGEAGLYWHEKKLQPFASEGGHVDFAPRNPLEIALLEFLLQEEKHASYERVLSGKGLYNIYQFLLSYHQKTIEGGLKEAFKTQDPAWVVSHYGLTKEDPLCEQALDLFVSLYGSEAGNVALKFMAVSGVYIGGGIAPKIIEKMKSPLFMDAFCQKGRLQTLLKKIPVYVILNDRTALLGAARYSFLMSQNIK